MMLQSEIGPDYSSGVKVKNNVRVDCYINNEEEKRCKKVIWEEMNKEYLKEQADKEAALKVANDALNESNSNCPEHARKLVEASKAAVAKSRKRLSGLINYDVLEELFDTHPDEEYHKRSKTETVMEKKEEKKEVRSNEHEDGENEYEDEAEEDQEVSYDMYTDFQNDEKLYEDEEGEEGYDFGLY